MILTQEQVSAVKDVVMREGVTLPSLTDDVVDHLCCLVELQMYDGQSFERALTNAIKELAPAGLFKIQLETYYLLQSNQITMKKFIYGIGLLTTISMTNGIMFKLLHMPGGEELFNYGFLTFAIFFLPAMAIMKLRQKTERPRYEKLKIIVGLISAVGVGAAVVLKMFSQLDPSGTFLLISVSIFCFGFLPLKFYSMYRRELKVAS